MSALKDNEELFTTAIKQVDQIIRKYPDNARFQLVDNDFAPSSMYVYGKQKALDMLTEVRYSHYSRSAAEIYNRQVNVLADQESDTRHVLWFTDTQKSTLGNLDNLPKDTTMTHFVFSLQDEEGIANAFVDSTYLENPFIRASENHVLKVRVRNSGHVALDEVNVILLIDDQEAGRSVAHIGAEATETVELNFIPQDTGQLQITVKLEDNALEFDNTHYLSLEVSSPIEILSISDSTKSKYASLYKNENIFKFKHFNANAIDFDRLSGQEVILLEELDQIPASLQAELHQLKTVTTMVIPSSKADMESYQNFLLPFGVKATPRAPFKEDMAAPNPDNAFLKGVFTKIDAKMDLPYFSPHITVSGYNISLLNSISKTPFLVNGGDGRELFIFTGSMATSSTNFGQHSFLVPVMYRLAMSGTHANKYIQYTLDQQMKKLNVTSASAKDLYKLQREDVVITPDQKIKGRELLIAVDPTQLSPGFYWVLQGDEKIKKIAFNRSLHEGDLTLIDKEQIDRFNDAEISSASTPAEALAGFNYGIALWKYCVLGALFFLLIEIALIRFFKT